MDSTSTTTPSHLVIVCGHATYNGEGDVWQESSWVLQPFQQSNAATQKPSEHYTFIQHILAGTSILERDNTAILVFSGGRTQNAVPLTEAESYRKALHVFNSTIREERVGTENDATDSFQNLLFSILQFQHMTGAYPKHITLITHAFKERRFLTAHAPAIRWPADRIRTMGLNPPFTQKEIDQVHMGENENAFKLFIRDPYGVKSPLADKRKTRNWDPATLERLATSFGDDVKELLLWRGGSSGQEHFDGPLPWA